MPSSSPSPLSISPDTPSSTDTHFLGSFSPSKSLKFFKQGSRGRVRKATEQEEFLPEDEVRVAGPLVVTALVVQGIILAVIYITMKVNHGGGGESDENADQGTRALGGGGTISKVGDALGNSTLQAYIALSIVPFLRLLCTFVMLSGTSSTFGLKERVAIGYLLLGQILRAASDDKDRGHLNDICPRYLKIINIFTDTILCLACSFVRRRISNLTQAGEQIKNKIKIHTPPSQF